MLLLFGTSPAWANEPPQIVEPSQATYTLTEGNTLAIRFTVDEPDNDVVDYFIDYLINGQVQPSLPAGANLVTDFKTAHWRLAWFPDLTQSGNYVFRFRAIDSAGNPAQRSITVTVQDRVNVPAVRVFWVPLQVQVSGIPKGQLTHDPDNRDPFYYVWSWQTYPTPESRE